MPEPSTARGEVLARLSHLEPLLAGRRVLVLGAPEDARASAEFLAARGVESPVAATDEAGLEPSFDRIVLHPRDGQRLSPERIGALRALLAPGGLLAVAVPADDDATEPLLRAAFPVVEPAALLPVAAWAVAAAGAGSAGVTWDGAGLGATRPSSLLFLCGDQPSGLRGATVMALPAAEPAAPAAVVPAVVVPDLADVAAAERADAREAELEAEVLALSWSRDDLARALAAAVAERDALQARVAAASAAPAAPRPDDLDDLLPP